MCAAHSKRIYVKISFSGMPVRHTLTNKVDMAELPCKKQKVERKETVVRDGGIKQICRAETKVDGMAEPPCKKQSRAEGNGSARRW